MSDDRLLPDYSNSFALIIGIDEYENAPPLGYAVSDAKAVEKTLREKFSFPEDNIRLLLNEDASHIAIHEAFLSFASGGTDANDRLIVFFAGHGHTVRTRKSEIGFLVPVEGDTKNLSSLIRWDELTRNADLIEAKHVLFIMDACYSGLAITRALKPGAMRFLKEMYLRHSRQVITAGKADQVVADSGGPLAGHSVFTGHLLEGLSGKATDTDGILTANGLMAYVYRMVGRDSESRQTPHFGYLDGDGDFVFQAPPLDDEEEGDDAGNNDILVPVPAVLSDQGDHAEMSVIDLTKELLSEEKHKIKLYDLLAQQIREVLSQTAGDLFQKEQKCTPEQFLKRIACYEVIMSDLIGVQMLLGRWGQEYHHDVLTLAPKSIAGTISSETGLPWWIRLRWYPQMLLLYAGGIAAASGGRYDNLARLYNASVICPERWRGRSTFIRAVWDAMDNLEGAFKMLPGLKNKKLPRSEHLFKYLQPRLDDLLFLGADYESCFDCFELFACVEYANQEFVAGKKTYWGPLGRFAWKHAAGDENSPVLQAVNAADREGDAWEPARAGLFQGSAQRFKEIASNLSDTINKHRWEI